MKDVIKYACELRQLKQKEMDLSQGEEWTHTQTASALP